jgi:hypothetical protein
MTSGFGSESARNVRGMLANCDNRGKIHKSRNMTRISVATVDDRCFWKFGIA